MNRFLISGILAVIFATPVLAQGHRLTLGIEAGVPLNDAFDSAPGYPTMTHRDGRKLLAGITGETPLPWGLALGGEVLFRPLAYHRTTSGIVPYPGNPDSAFAKFPYQRTWRDLRGHAWEFPVTLKKLFSTRRRINPFADMGVAFRHTRITTHSEFEQAGEFFKAPPTSVQDWRMGLVVAAGAEIHGLPVRLSPEVRWTPWLTDGRMVQPFVLGPARHSVDFLIGIKIK